MHDSGKRKQCKSKPMVNLQFMFLLWLFKLGGESSDILHIFVISPWETNGGYSEDFIFIHFGIATSQAMDDECFQPVGFDRPARARRMPWLTACCASATRFNLAGKKKLKAHLSA